MDTAGSGRQKFRAEIIMQMTECRIRGRDESPAARMDTGGRSHGVLFRLLAENGWGINLALGGKLASARPGPAAAGRFPAKAGGLPAASGILQKRSRRQPSVCIINSQAAQAFVFQCSKKPGSADSALKQSRPLLHARARRKMDTSTTLLLAQTRLVILQIRESRLPRLFPQQLHRRSDLPASLGLLVPAGLCLFRRSPCFATSNRRLRCDFCLRLPSPKLGLEFRDLGINATSLGH